MLKTLEEGWGEVMGDRWGDCGGDEAQLAGGHTVAIEVEELV
jgi:hypothetical protein